MGASGSSRQLRLWVPTFVGTTNITLSDEMCACASAKAGVQQGLRQGIGGNLEGLVSRSVVAYNSTRALIGPAVGFS